MDCKNVSIKSKFLFGSVVRVLLIEPRLDCYIYVHVMGCMKYKDHSRPSS